MRVVMVDPGAYTPFHDDALCRALAALDCEVELVTAPFVYHPWPEAAGYTRRELFAPGAGFAGWARRGLRRIHRALSYPGLWRRLASELERRPPDVVHLQWSLLPSVERRALRRLRAAGIAVVQTVHNARPHPGERSRFLGGVGGAGGVLLAREIDACVALSEATARALLAAEPALSPKLRILPPGIAAPAAPAQTAAGEAADRFAARHRLGLVPEAPIALFLGLIRPYKGLDLLLEAFVGVSRQLPQARLVVAGLPRLSFRPYARQIERCGLGERVHTDLRYLPQTVMDDYLTAADLVVLPYREASQSAVLGAALARDRPVVATSTGALPEMLAETASEMLIPAGDAAALAGAIGRLLGDRPAAAELGRRAGRAARLRYSWPRSAAATLELYREVSSARRAARNLGEMRP